MAGERIHYGSLEFSDKAKVAARPSPTTFSQKSGETLSFSQGTVEAQEKHVDLMTELELRKKAKSLVVPTDDKLVQARLRELGEPIIFFGEEPLERRDRLRMLMVKRGIENGMPSSALAQATSLAAASAQSRQEPDELFYTEGSPFLKTARIAIAKYSLPRAHERLQRAKLLRQRDEADGGATFERENATFRRSCSVFDSFVNTASQVGDDRPLSCCVFTHDSENLITSSWGGLAKMWKVSDCSLVQTFRGHTDRCTSVVLHPFSATQSPSSCSLATGGADGRVMLWSMDSSSPLHVLTGHEHRVNRVAFHPSGKFLASASHDLSWRLWDAETGKDILEQEGHSRPIMGIGFQSDGSLLCSAGMDHIGRVWDLRSGKAIYVMRGHSKQIHELDWAPNGYQIATCSEDNTVRIWDLRKKRPVYIIPAHENVVSHVKYHAEGKMILTCSFDNTVRMWSGIDWTPLKTIHAGEGKILYSDLSPDFKHVATANYDRTWKLYTQDEATMNV